MSLPNRPDPVKLIASLFSPEKELLEWAAGELCRRYGPTDWISRELFFDRTRYYEKEMGWPLHRRFVSFERLISPEAIAAVKLQTNEIEHLRSEGKDRRVNIDPGYISPERLILATGKNFTHRVYLSRGIYADLTLIFQRGSFRTLPWTYEDYADPEAIGWFNDVRARLMAQLKGEKEFG